MLDFPHGEHFAQQFRNFDRCGTYQYGAAGFYHFYDFVDDGCIFFAFGFIYAVVEVLTNNRFVGGDRYDVEFIDVPELAGFGLGCTRHTG